MPLLPSRDILEPRWNLVYDRIWYIVGMEALEMSITYWEDAMSAYARNNTADSLAITNEEESEFCKELQRLLDAAYKLQDECELLFLDQVR